MSRESSSTPTNPSDSKASSSGKRLSPIQLQKYLKGAQYPASKDDLSHRAEDNQAPDDILNFIRRLPADSFNGPKDVMRALGKTE